MAMHQPNVGGNIKTFGVLCIAVQGLSIYHLFPAAPDDGPCLVPPSFTLKVYLGVDNGCDLS